MKFANRGAGFTLLEIIIVIVISGILGGVIMQVVGDITSGYARQSARQELVGIARAALDRMKRDIRRAIPGTVWISDDKDRITFFLASDVGRYKREEMENRDLGKSNSTIPIYGPTQSMSPTPQALIVNPHSSKLDLKDGANDFYSSDKSPYQTINNGSGCRARLDSWNKNNINLNSNDWFSFDSPSPTYRIYASNKVVSYWFKNKDSDQNFSVKRESVNISDIGVQKISKDLDNLEDEDSFLSSILVNNVANDDRSNQGEGTWFKKGDLSHNLYRIRLVLTAKQGTVPDHVQISVEEDVQVRNGY